MNDVEIWKDIVGYEGFYQVSNLGNIKRLSLSKEVLRNGKAMIFNHPERKLNGSLNTDGYIRVELSCIKKPKRVCRFIHRLVAEHFCDNINSSPEVNHLDGNKLNNKSENLQWVTGKENVQHSFKNGLNRNHSERHVKAKLKNCDVLEIRKLLKDGEAIPEIAKKYNVSLTPIYHIKSNRTWKRLV